MKLITSIILLLSLFSCVFAQESRKIDKFGDLSCDDITLRIGDFFEEVKNLENSKGYVVIYNGKLDYRAKNKIYNYPHQNEVKAEIENIKTRIKFYYFDENRIVLIDGGFRENFTIEFWLVPNGATPPKPTPTLKKMKYRKGKAEPSCKYI
jgi:hypothetical protein